MSIYCIYKNLILLYVVCWKVKFIKVFAIDSASKKSGWSFFINNKLIDYGLIRANEKDDVDNRIMQIYLEIKKLVQKYEPDYIVFENTPSMNAKVARDLSRIHGCIMSLVFDSDGKMGFRDYMPTTWRSIIGTYNGTKAGQKRDYQKQKAIEIVNTKYNKQFIYDKSDKNGDDDICEAILLGEAFYIIENEE
jgi:Holliday junction resolvasome RuvABC endonuclease subunit